MCHEVNILDIYITDAYHNLTSLALVDSTFTLKIHCLAGSLTFNIFGSRLTCSVFRLMRDLADLRVRPLEAQLMST